MNILAIDQARAGGWCIFDYEKKVPVKYGTFSFPNEEYTYAKVLVEVCDLAQSLMDENDISAVFVEDIQMRQNVLSFKRLAQLQGCLVSMFERNEYLYDFIPPSKWQGYCGARGRTAKEVKGKVTELEAGGKKESKMLSIQFVKERFGIETDNDNLSDAICMGYWAAMNVPITVCGNETCKEKSSPKLSDRR